jgi:hypothetical protein
LPASIRETQTDVVAKSAHRVRDYLREISVELVTVRQGVDDIFKELPAIRDTAGKATIILDELSVTSAKISTLHDELPMMSGKITTIHDDIPVLAGKVTVIHDELPAIRDALQRLAVSIITDAELFDGIWTDGMAAESTSPSGTHLGTVGTGSIYHAI